jgi:kinesin family protein 12
MVVECTSQQDLVAVLHEGMKNRKSGSHELNKDSSRSHSILTVYLISETSSPEDGHIFKKYGKISFVDLAGSERLKESKSQGEMIKETGQINKSLFTLGKVISMLSSTDKKGAPKDKLEA